MRPQNTLRRAISGILGVSAIAIVAVLSMPAQNDPGNGYPDDWTHHHVIFSNPGTMEDALKSGTYDRWVRIVNDPRYRIQQMKRNPRPAPPDDGGGEIIIGGGLHKKLLHDDWAVPLTSSSGGVSAGMFPAKYTFSINGTPDCVNDYVVFPDNGGGGSIADVVGVNNLYNTTCSGSVPTVLFAYSVGPGNIQTSPALSLDGKKIAFVESRTNANYFHVLTIDRSGNSGCPSSPPCNGTAYNAPAVPGTNNAAVDTKILMNSSVNISRSSPFVDYANDVAYTGDNNGKLHKFTGVFNGTLAEAGSPWPVQVFGGYLEGPIYDSVSGNIFMTATDGRLYCVTSAGAPCAIPNITLGTQDTFAYAIVDSTEQTVFAPGETSNVVLVQATTSLGSPVTAIMGSANGTQRIYSGAFDSAYFANVSTGHMYFCGNDANDFPTLYRVSFNSSGTMSSTRDSGSFALTTGATVNCPPLTEIFNTSQGNDYLFVGIANNGFSTGTPNCNNLTCIASFILPTSDPFTFPTAAFATTTTNLGSNGTSGMIIDNVSSLAGASQIYFGNLQNGTGVQASQSALQ